MIHMLSKFDLKPGKNFEEFADHYANFVKHLCRLGIIESADPIGRRVHNTPMDTAGNKEPEFFAIMSFKDRQHLDQAYSHFVGLDNSHMEQSEHANVQSHITNSEFVCWQDITE